MGHPSDVLIGIDAVLGAIGVAAFDRDGHQLGGARRVVAVERSADGGAEQDPGATWQAVVRVLRDLALRVPDLARRTVALAVTGDGDGTWLIDEDGDPVGAALTSADRRARAQVARWQGGTVGVAVEAITGCRLTPALQSSQLAWLLAHQPDRLARADRALSAKDWLYFCCTGEAMTEPGQAVAFGDGCTARPAPRVLELLGLGAIERLLPESAAGPHRGALGAVAAAATGLAAGTPVLLAPSRTIAMALSVGLDRVQPDLGCTILGAHDAHLRAHAEPVATPPRHPGGRLVTVARGAPPYGMVEPEGRSTAIDWLVGFAGQLLADAGLIGIGRDDVLATLERGAARARPCAVALQGFGSPTGGRALDLTGETTPYDLVRAAHEAIGWGARAAYRALDLRPAEIRLVGRPGVLGRAILAATTGAVVRPLARAEPAATGAALLAAIDLGLQGSLAAAAADWITPHLEPPIAVDPELQAIYDDSFAAWCAGERSADQGEPDHPTSAPIDRGSSP